MDFDVIIVGGNFAGLSAALQLARVRRRILVVDDGQPRNRFAAESHGFLGQDGVAPYEIKRHAGFQLSLYSSVEMRDGRVAAAKPIENGFEIRTATGEIFRGRKLLLAIGVKDALPPIPGLSDRWGSSVLHCPYCHGYEVRDRRLGALAPQSAQTALLLPDLGPTTFFTQGIFEPDGDLKSRFEARGIMIERTPVAEVLGEAPEMTAVRLVDGRAIEVDAIFVASHIAMTSDLPSQLSCALTDGPAGPIIQVDSGQQTSTPGVFATGDAASIMHSATFAAASGVLAGVSIHRALVSDQSGMRV